MAYKRMKPARPPGSAPVATQFAADLRQAATLKDKGRIQEAVQQLENLHRRYPTRMEPLSLLLDVALENKNNILYADVIGRMLQIAPDNPDMVLAQAKITFSNGQVALALQRFRHFLVRWPQHEEAQEAQETSAFLEEQLTKMMDEAGLHQVNRFELAAKNDEVQSFMLQGRWDEARRLARQLLDDNPHYAPALNNATLTYILNGQLDEAISCAERVLEFEPDNVHALGNLARCLHLLGRREEAALYAERMQASEAFAADKADKIAETLSFLGDDVGVLASINVYDTIIAVPTRKACSCTTWRPRPRCGWDNKKRRRTIGSWPSSSIPILRLQRTT